MMSEPKFESSEMKGTYNNLGEYIDDAKAAGIEVKPSILAEWEAQVAAHNAKAAELLEMEGVR